MGSCSWKMKATEKQATTNSRRSGCFDFDMGAAILDVGFRIKKEKEPMLPNTLLYVYAYIKRDFLFLQYIGHATKFNLHFL